MLAYIRFIVLLLPACLTFQIDQFERENVCTADPGIVGILSEYKSCYKMKHSRVYKSSSEREVHIEINKSRRVHSRYPTKFNITILRIYNESYSSINSCCSLNEPCKLPASDGAEYTIIAPTTNNEYPYCHKTIHVTRGMPQWCYINPTCPCVYLDKGCLTINETYMDFCGTGCAQQTQTDFCFFELPGRYGQLGHKTQYGLTVNVRDVPFSREKACEEGKRRDDLMGALPSLFSFYSAKPGNTMCAYYRMKSNYTADWRQEPICLTEPAAFPWRIILIVVAISVIVLAALIALAVLYKRHVKICFPSYKKTVEEMKSMKFDLSSSEDGSMKKFEKEGEIPTKILGNGDTPYHRASLETQRYVIGPTANNRCSSKEAIDVVGDPIIRQLSNRVDEDIDQLSEQTLETPCDNDDGDSREFFPSERNSEEVFAESGYMPKVELEPMSPVTADLQDIEFFPYQSKNIQPTTAHNESLTYTEKETDTINDIKRQEAEKAFLNKLKIKHLPSEESNTDIPDYMMQAQKPTWANITPPPAEHIDWASVNDGYMAKDALPFADKTKILPSSGTSSNSNTSQNIFLPRGGTVGTDGDYMSKDALF